MQENVFATSNSATTKRIKVSDVVFREDLYPRIETSAQTVQKYAENLEVLPPIEVNQHNELIDGWHRWTAHKKLGLDEIDVIVTQTQSDAHLLELAIMRNATHGLQLSNQDKREMARRIYLITDERKRDEKKTYLAKVLSVTERTIRSWLSDIDKDTEKKQEQTIAQLWLACYTQEEIAERVNLPQQTVSDILNRIIKNFTENGKFSEFGKTDSKFLVDFEPPLYNIWSFAKKTNEVSHFGNSEQRILDNLLYLYTQEFDVVVDPFAGGGSTIDVCKKRLRRYFVSDCKPIVEREKEIRQHDIVTDGLPPVPRWQDVKLVYLDPPYWKQAEGKYSNDPTDLANMDLDTFHKTLIDLINGFASKLPKGARIAMLMQPTQWNAPDKKFTDHILEIAQGVDCEIENRVSCPYSTQQCTPQMVEYAKANKMLLVLTRELVIWTV